MKLFTLSVIAGLLLWPMIGSAELYKWTDEQGNLHITDAPPLERQKRSSPTVRPSPRSTLPKKATVKPAMPELFQAEVRSVPDPSVMPSSSKDAAAQPSMKGLSPNQATLTSAWQTFDGPQVIARVPVQRWKDERGVEHFGDVLPTVKDLTGVEATPNKHRPNAQ
ncbi:MAG: DUF4124 domain-containing protein [Nitrospira sp.]|nr:DUF4124 domain-containing protein [Nitrospira sp.]MDH4369281.1 DUF4124 domain-containing protein [Nitrospira sp.]MDH5347395.1 DUF4124 domain-containing protein [Nitrospira sp.]MDH5496027.1 DUF4124 domain-containing protein [Nitrospira sp.]MDH5726061.1 DUF4124 domain-containing protein [Nitrospira sp.]